VLCTGAQCLRRCFVPLLGCNTALYSRRQCVRLRTRSPISGQSKSREGFRTFLTA
jgi:hypothetical protein